MVAVVSAPTPKTDALTRLAPLDRMRGLVIALMAVDHSSEAFNAGRLFTDSALFYKPGTPLPAAQFLTRWLTHLCAPTFLFLAGVGLAFSLEKERTRPGGAWAADRYLLVRGLMIVAFEAWVSLFLVPHGVWLMQVLYAIGTSYLLMIPLRRLPTRAAGVLAVALIVGLEAASRAAVGAVAGGDPSQLPLPLALLAVPRPRPPVILGYPTLPWLAILLLGWTLGRHLVAHPEARAGLGRWFARGGVALLAVFAIVRGVNGYGNMGLLRDGGALDASTDRNVNERSMAPDGDRGVRASAASESNDREARLRRAGVDGRRWGGPAGGAQAPSASGEAALVQWLHVSKYPPSLSYVALELGLMGLGLAWMFALARRRPAGPNDVLIVLGQTPMFFYLLHFPLLAGAARVLGIGHKLGLAATYVGAVAVVAVLYPACRWYRGFKASGRHPWTRYV